jgi:cysteine desulfurase
VRIYLDHNATTPVRDEVVDEVVEALRSGWGNPSSVHAEGARARACVDRARERVASLLGARPDEVLFTAGATEANNTALLGLVAARGGAAGSVVSSSVEHPSVEAALEVLAHAGWRVVRVPVDGDGVVDADEMGRAIADDTALVSLIWGNNETGAIQPVARVAARARERGVPLHVDATQCVGKIPIDLGGVPVDLLSLSAHKFGGPKGVGCLVVRGGLRLEPLLHGGPQERRLRGGTENVPGIAGLGAACALAERELDERRADFARLRDRLWQGIAEKIPRVRRNGPVDSVLPNTLNVEFEEAAGEVLLQALDLEGVAVSAGAACASGSIQASHVLSAMGRSAEQARGSLRFSVGFGVDAAQIDRVLALLPELVARARACPAA